MNLVGKVIGNRYEILEKIGEGGMATVYKAKCNILKRYVAVKVLRDEFTTDEEFIKRFNTEAQAAASLTHPNIVSIYDVGHEENIYYIVMELVQGKTLKEIITEDGVLPWKWSVNIAIQVASALEMAHKNDIVHRDIKPHNIIITEEGIAKVTDFGIAKAVSNSTITAFGTTIGSVHYFSPEHARGGYTDAKSDLYSLGVVMYEMLTGRVPFDADTPVSIALKHMQEKPIEPIKLNPSIPYAINKIIMKAMEKDTSTRYQSATEMLKDFSLALKDPEGDFVKNNAEGMQYTQRIPTFSEERLEEVRREEEKMKEKGNKGYFEEHPKTKKVIIATTICVIIAILAVIGVFVIFPAMLEEGKPKDIEIPNLVGKTVEEAKAQIGEEKITLEISEEKHDDEVEEGKIISQDPPYSIGYQIKENSIIKIVVSKGQKTAKVTKVVGKTYEEAEQEIKALELEVEKIEQTSKTVQEGYVIKQEPEEGKELKTGEKVKLYVSTGTGIKEVSVPYTVGDTEAVATKKLKDLKLKSTIVTEEDRTKPNGTVLKQSIESGKTVEEGTTITLTINKISELKTGKVTINLKSVLGDKSTISIDPETGAEIEPTGVLKVTVDDETVYLDENARKDLTNVQFDVSGRGTVEVKVWFNDIREALEQFDLSVQNPTLNID